MSDAALEVRDLCFGYGDVPVWEDVSFSLAAGRVAFLTGPNGAGKSTLFRCLAGWLEPDEGEVLLGGAPFTGRTRLAPGTLAFVPDVPSFYDDLTAMEHVEFVLAANRADSARSRAQRLLERFGLVGHERLLPSAYSRWCSRSRFDRACCCSTSLTVRSTARRRSRSPMSLRLRRARGRPCS